MSYTALLNGLAEEILLPEDWEALFASTPRATFVPDVIWTWDAQQARYRRTDRNKNPRRWARLVNSREVVVTQLDDGQDDGPGLATSSSSMPEVVATMLAADDLQPGQRVFEIGGGGGWTAALRKKRVGPTGLVVTTETDPHLAKTCAANLARHGADVTVLHADGAAGHPDLGPYDRTCSTAAVQRVPAAWIAQTRPGGLITTPFHTSLADFGLLKLTVADDGQSASGTFAGTVSFMWLRQQRPPGTPDTPASDDEPRVTTARTLPSYLSNRRAARLYIGLRTPGVHYRLAWNPPDQWETSRIRLWAADGSKAIALANPPYTVYERGPRSLWHDVVEPHLADWVALQQPRLDQIGMSVTADGTHTLWTGSPDSPTTLTLPPN
ncbi:protein-L-isoaspartate(D-aspartate) O-methyltransferase [Streptomyces sp. NPDC050485]|uniref:protein-L-isoaspartate(D-aspartate) O-methyltransferase n=1 Tax=Streptomyces sp. NPDC050485 TaxID=3365617 RepID=UPI0037A5195B